VANLRNVFLPLLAGAGQGLQVLADESRRDAEQRARDEDRRAQRVLQQHEIDRDLREQGLRPMSDSDLADAGMRALNQMPGPSITPPAITVPRPTVAPLPPIGAPASSTSPRGDQRTLADQAMTALGPSAQRKYAESANAAAVAGQPAPPTPADQAMLQLTVQNTFKPKHGPTEEQDGPTLAAALHPQAMQDVYGNTRQYVADPSITAEARGMRDLVRRMDLERQNTIAVRDSEIATQQNQASIDRDRRTKAYIAAGYTPQQAAAAAENPALADNFYSSAHPRAESPSEVEYRRGLTDERLQRERDMTAKYVAGAADKFVEAANGDPNLAASFALQDPHGQTAISAGMGRADFQAAAQRYRDRFTAKSKSTDDESAFLESLRGRQNAGGRGGVSPRAAAAPATMPAGSGVPAASPSTASAPTTAAASANGKRIIGRDEADYIKAKRGWTDAQIATRYVVR
jgi:hypothetical protein